MIERCSTAASGFGEVKMIRSFRLLDTNARDTAPRRNPVLRFCPATFWFSGPDNAPWRRSLSRRTRRSHLRSVAAPPVHYRLSEPHRKVSPLQGLGVEVLEDVGGASIDEVATPPASVPSVSCADFAVGPGIQIKPASKSAHEAC